MALNSQTCGVRGKGILARPVAIILPLDTEQAEAAMVQATDLRDGNHFTFGRRFNRRASASGTRTLRAIYGPVASQGCPDPTCVRIDERSETAGTVSFEAFRVRDPGTSRPLVL